jgi:hypothetical protein
MNIEHAYWNKSVPVVFKKDPAAQDVQAEAPEDSEDMT